MTNQATPSANPGALPANGFIRERALVRDTPKILPIGPATLWRWVKAGRFPKPCRLGPGVTAWRVEEVRAWMAQQEAITTGSTK